MCTSNVLAVSNALLLSNSSDPNEGGYNKQKQRRSTEIETFVPLVKGCYKTKWVGSHQIGGGILLKVPANWGKGQKCV